MIDHTIIFFYRCPAGGSMDGQAARITGIIFRQQQCIALH
jgi:hypothetical protein